MNRQELTFAARRGLLLGTILLSTAPASGQTSQPALPADKTIPYADYAFGFEMRLPGGWEYDRTRFAGPEGAIGLIRGRVSSGTRTLTILIFRKDPVVEFEQWLTAFQAQLLNMPGAIKITRRTWENFERPRTALELDSRVAVSKTRSGYLCVPFDRDTIWVFVYGGVLSPEVNEETLRREFDALGSSLRVLYTREEAEKFTAAAERGRALIEQLVSVASEVRIDPTERFYEIRLDGKSIGYLSRALSRETRSLTDARFARRSATTAAGLRLRERSWRFAEDGTVNYSKIDLFCSFDFQSELIETRETRIPPATSDQPLYITLDQCIREHDVLFSSFSTNRDRRLPKPRPPIRPGPAYLALAWVRMLPAVLGREPGEMHAFSIYDSPTRALVTQKLRALGPRPLPGRPDTRAFAFETYEGFAPERDLIYTDERGNLLRLEAGKLVLEETTEAAVLRKYAARRDAARERLKRRAPAEPKPGPVSSRP